MRFVSLFLALWGYAVRAKRIAGTQRRRAKRHLARFYKDAWHEAAGEAGATFEELGVGTFRMTRDGVSIKVHNQYTELDSAPSAIALDNFSSIRSFARMVCQRQIMPSFP